MADKAPTLPEIKPCPFCGGLPLILYDAGALSIQCKNNVCVAPETGRHPTDISLKRWNDRAAQPDTHVLVPREPKLNGKMANVLGRVQMMTGDYVHISGEDIIKSGMWRNMIAAHEGENDKP